MKIILAARDRTDEFRASISDAVRRMEAKGVCTFLPPEISALRLREAQTEAEYLDMFTDLVRRRQHVDTRGFVIPRRGGAVGRLLWIIRALLWEALRYQHDRMAFRQNQVNSNLMALLEAQGEELRRLRREVERLKDQR